MAISVSFNHLNDNGNMAVVTIKPDWKKNIFSELIGQFFAYQTFSSKISENFLIFNMFLAIPREHWAQGLIFTSLETELNGAFLKWRELIRAFCKFWQKKQNFSMFLAILRKHWDEGLIFASLEAELNGAFMKWSKIRAFCKFWQKYRIPPVFLTGATKKWTVHQLKH